MLRGVGRKWIKNGEKGIIQGNPRSDIESIWVNGNIFGLCIYFNGKWAEIESKIIQKEWVKCNTQEEWDFVAKKLGRTDPTKFKVNGDCIKLTLPNTSRFTKPEEYYTFKEWLELNGLSIGTIKWIDKGTINNFTIEYPATPDEYVKQQEFDPYSQIIELE